MTPALIIAEDHGAAARIFELFGVTVDELRRVVSESVGARRNAIDDDPATTPGTLAYIYGTRALRQLFRGRGWDLDRTNGVESVVSVDLGRKIIFQNSDLSGEPNHNPQAISRKGPASANAVRSGQPYLFPEMEKEDLARSSANVWFLLVSVDGDDVRAEISFPRSIDDHRFTSFHERIFLINKGEFDDVRIDLPADDRSQPVEVIITRK